MKTAHVQFPKDGQRGKRQWMSLPPDGPDPELDAVSEGKDEVEVELDGRLHVWRAAVPAGGSRA
jgi:hypothetical protein